MNYADNHIMRRREQGRGTRADQRPAAHAPYSKCREALTET